MSPMQVSLMACIDVAGLCEVSGRYRSLCETVGVTFKKVSVEHGADAEQQIRIYTRPMKDFVNISAIAIKLAR